MSFGANLSRALNAFRRLRMMSKWSFVAGSDVWFAAASLVWR